MTDKKDWRLFEEIVAQFEKSLLPENATIKTPDKIADLTTNQKEKLMHLFDITLAQCQF